MWHEQKHTPFKKNSLKDRSKREVEVSSEQTVDQEDVSEVQLGEREKEQPV